jgi:hypothetical protein
VRYAVGMRLIAAVLLGLAGCSSASSPPADAALPADAAADGPGPDAGSPADLATGDALPDGAVSDAPLTADSASPDLSSPQPDGPAPCPCPTLGALLAQCQPSGSCVGMPGLQSDQCFANGVKVRWTFEASGIGILQIHHQVYKPDGALCYGVRQTILPSGLEYSDAAGRVIATVDWSAGGQWTCDGMSSGPRPYGTCDIARSMCADGACAIP